MFQFWKKGELRPIIIYSYTVGHTLVINGGGLISIPNHFEIHRNYRQFFFFLLTLIEFERSLCIVRRKKGNNILSTCFQAKENILIAYSGKNLRSSNNMEGDVILTENDWFYVTKDFKNLETPVDNTEVSRDEFLSILSDIKHVLIKAKYHTNQVESTYVLNMYTIRWQLFYNFQI